MLRSVRMIFILNRMIYKGPEWSYLQCRRRVHGFAEREGDLGRARWDRRWRKWTGGRIRTSESRAWWPLRSCADDAGRETIGSRRETRSFESRMRTGMWPKAATVDPWCHLKCCKQGTGQQQWAVFKSLTSITIFVELKSNKFETTTFQLGIEIHFLLSIPIVKF